MNSTDPPKALRSEELEELEELEQLEERDGPSTRQSATDLERFTLPMPPRRQRPPPPPARAPAARTEVPGPPSSGGSKGKAYWWLLGVAAIVAAGGGFAACAPIIQALTGAAEVEERRAKDREELLRLVRQLSAQVKVLDDRIFVLGSYSGGVAEAGGLDVLPRPGAPPATSITVGPPPLESQGVVRRRTPRRQVVAPELGAPLEPIQIPEK